LQNSIKIVEEEGEVEIEEKSNRLSNVYIYVLNIHAIDFSGSLLF